MARIEIEGVKYGPRDELPRPVVPIEAPPDAATDDGDTSGFIPPAPEAPSIEDQLTAAGVVTGRGGWYTLANGTKVHGRAKVLEALGI